MSCLRLGTRTSPLALWQTQHIAASLEAAWPEVRCTLTPITTQGDSALSAPLPSIGGKGLFTQELEHALLAGAIDLAVHSLKDLPTQLPSGLTLGAIVGRADVRDVLVAPHGETLTSLPAGARIGTSSRRRAAMLRALRPDLHPVSIRGNVDTRLRKASAGEVEALVLAAAGVLRLGLEEHITQWFSLEEMLPAPGQGALGVQCRADDGVTLRYLAALDSSQVRAGVTAERAFLHALGGGCATPVGAYAQLLDGDTGRLRLTGAALAPDGSRQIRVVGEGADAQTLGEGLAHQALAQGAATLLAYP